MDQTRKAQVGAEPTTEERKHLEECRREEMELLKGKGGSPESEADKMVKQAKKKGGAK